MLLLVSELCRGRNSSLITRGARCDPNSTLESVRWPLEFALHVGR